MHQDNCQAIHAALRAISIGSYVFQSEVATRLGLNPTDLQAIYRLGLAPNGLSAGALGTQLGLTSGAVTTAIDRLTRAGFVERALDPADRRRVLLKVRRSGMTKLRAEYGSIQTRVDAALAEFASPELDVIARFLQLIAGSPS